MGLHPEGATKRFVVLDGWRGIAALLVAAFHFQIYVSSHLQALAFVRHSWLFVDYFFVLSGFVIAATYGDRLPDWKSVRRFVLLRFGRIYPLHFAVLLLYLVGPATQGLAYIVMFLVGATTAGATPHITLPDSPESLVTNLFLVQSFGLHDRVTWNGPSWSISAEFYTYLLFAAVAYLARARLRLFLAVAVVPAPLIIGVLSPRLMNTTYDFGFIRCVYGFSIGVWLWTVYPELSQRLGRRLSDWRIATAVETAALLFSILFVARTGPTTTGLLAPFVFAIAVLIFSFEAGFVSRLLNARFFQLLGLYSYSIYMVHWFLKDEFLGLARIFDGTVRHGDHDYIATDLWRGDVLSLLFLGIVVVTSASTFVLIEKPSRDWFRRVARRPTSGAQEAPHGDLAPRRLALRLIRSRFLLR